MAKLRERLEIGRGFALPLDAVTQTFAVLGKRGSGKTNMGVVLVEEMVAHGLPVVVIDPVGVWWGLRASANRRDPGLPVIILGGEHADVSCLSCKAPQRRAEGRELLRVHDAGSSRTVIVRLDRRAATRCDDRHAVDGCDPGGSAWLGWRAAQQRRLEAGSSENIASLQAAEEREARRYRDACARYCERRA